MSHWVGRRRRFMESLKRSSFTSFASFSSLSLFTFASYYASCSELFLRVCGLSASEGRDVHGNRTKEVLYPMRQMRRWCTRSRRGKVEATFMLLTLRSLLEPFLPSVLRERKRVSSEREVLFVKPRERRIYLTPCSLAMACTLVCLIIQVV